MPEQGLPRHRKGWEWHADKRNGAGQGGAAGAGAWGRSGAECGATEKVVIPPHPQGIACRTLAESVDAQVLYTNGVVFAYNLCTSSRIL